MLISNSFALFFEICFCISFLRVHSFVSYYQSQIVQLSPLSFSHNDYIFNFKDTYRLKRSSDITIGRRIEKTSISVVSPEFKSKSFSSVEGRLFKLNEVIENEVSECTIRLATNGKITFLPDESGVEDSSASVVSGSWKHENSHLRMGKYATYTVKSYYKETRKETSHGLTFIGGEVCDTTAERGGPEQPSLGQFLLVSVVPARE